MPTGRVICMQLPICPGRDSRFTIRHNDLQPNSPWWVYYEAPGGNLMPADAPHQAVVDLVNDLKLLEGNSEGGGFSINEHGQVIARMTAPPGYRGNAIHVAGVSAGAVIVYKTPITFQGGTIDPTITPIEGTPWTGPLCGMTYSFAAPGNPRPPSRNYNEVWTEIDGQIHQLSADARVSPYPPQSGPLGNFLAALRRQLPNGGRFRVNEHGRAFTSDQSIYIGTIPYGSWFPPLTPQS